ncbi:unnamed protein product [Closterium sp. NIES-65]|nr:unnamed protein product [Closterium sp. NIES-65]
MVTGHSLGGALLQQRFSLPPFSIHCSLPPIVLLSCHHATRYHIMVTGHSLGGALLQQRFSYHIMVTGHSLGGALSTLFTYDLAQSDLKKQHGFTLSLYNFGSPRVGNHAFAARFNQLVGDSWRIANDHDIVPRVPYVLYKHVATGVVLRPDSQKLEKVGGSGVSSTAVRAWVCWCRMCLTCSTSTWPRGWYFAPTRRNWKWWVGAVNRVANDHDIVPRVSYVFYKHVATGVVVRPDSQKLDKHVATGVVVWPDSQKLDKVGDRSEQPKLLFDGAGASKHSQPAYFLSLLKVSCLVAVWWGEGGLRPSHALIAGILPLAAQGALLAGLCSQGV